MDIPRQVVLSEVLEPEAVAKMMGNPADSVQLSQAVSLKRIANALEELVEVAKTPLVEVGDAG
jgi:hypothetical protein